MNCYKISWFKEYPCFLYTGRKGDERYTYLNGNSITEVRETMREWYPDFPDMTITFDHKIKECL